MAEVIGAVAALACALFAGAAACINLVEHPARALLEAWGRLHAVRSVLSLVASLLFLLGLNGPWS